MGEHFCCRSVLGPLACHLGIIHLGPADGLAPVVSPGAV